MSTHETRAAPAQRGPRESDRLTGTISRENNRTAVLAQVRVDGREPIVVRLQQGGRGIDLAICAIRSHAGRQIRQRLAINVGQLDHLIRGLLDIRELAFAAGLLDGGHHGENRCLQPCRAARRLPLNSAATALLCEIEADLKARNIRPTSLNVLSAATDRHVTDQVVAQLAAILRRRP